jgi:hypothetical protein
MNKDKKESKHVSYKRAIRVLKTEMDRELEHLKAIMTGEVEETVIIDQNSQEKSEIYEEAQGISLQSPALNEKSLSKSSNIKDKVRDALIWESAKNYYTLLNNPKYKKEYLRFLTSFQEVLQVKFEEVYFDAKKFHKQVSQIIDESFNDMRSRFEKPSKLKEESIKFATAHFNLREHYKKVLDEIPRKMRRKLKDDIKALFKEEATILDLRELYISKLCKTAKKSSIQQALIHRYQIFREMFPEKQDFIDFILKGWEIDNRLVKIIKKLLAEDERSQKIYDFAMDMVLKSNKIIISDFTKLEAEKIYNP